MNPLAAVDPVIGIIVVAVVGPLVTYLIAVRRLSGKVGSSDASELWAESRSIREWSAERIGQLNVLVARLEERIALCEGQNTDLARANANLVQQVHDLNNTISRLRTEVVALTTELRTSRERVAELEEERDD